MKRIFCTLIIATMLLILQQQTFAALNDGLVAYWPFNGNANDETGNGNDGIVLGPTLCEDKFGIVDSAYCFDGVDDYINIGNNVKPPFPITVSTWIKVKNFHHGKFFSNDYNNDTSNRYGFDLAVLSDGRVTSATYEGFSAPWNRVSKYTKDPVLTIENWHHFAVILNAHNNIQLFFDGAEIAGPYEGTGSSMQYSNGDGWIGKEQAEKYPFYGAIDRIRVYNRALSADEILKLFSELPVGHLDYCRLFGPCIEGQGNCEGDAECVDGLTCVQDVGANYGWAADINVCEQTTNGNEGDTGVVAESTPVQWEIASGGNGHFYNVILVGTPLSWNDARSAAKTIGSNWDLVTITSSSENDFVKSLFVNDPSFFNTFAFSGVGNRSGPWIGAFDVFGSTNFKWVTGESVVFTDWGPSEPFGNGRTVSYTDFNVPFGDGNGIAWNDIGPELRTDGPIAYIAETLDPEQTPDESVNVVDGGGGGGGGGCFISTMLVHQEL